MQICETDVFVALEKELRSFVRFSLGNRGGTYPTRRGGHAERDLADPQLIVTGFSTGFSSYANATVIGAGLSVTRFFIAPLVTLLSISLKRPSASLF